ncbi:hypothetical protein L6452_27789 [Arctium lappa]|uniref:Uncharacterized protein n=1 Tax=Arctium lappa TaxID=4217 RepID=A0ACB8ZXK6_ARCLA|nr:hypothetical protein L6452_27789 [Arctium lappa]
MDGTFNQTKPLDLLVGSRVWLSFDPRSATDRWPIVFLERVVSKLFNQDFSEAVSFLLSSGEFDVPWVTTPGSTVRFLSGTCVSGKGFTNYVVLGDDVVIADENVVTRYKESLDLLQVVISKEKSLISRSGSAEFTNNFRVRDLIVDISPYSIKALLNTFHPYGLMAVAHRYSVRDFRLLCRLGGAGYRVLARLDHRRPRRPEAHGHLVRLLRANLKPQELVFPPDELFETEESRDFLEYSLLYGWMRKWLNYLKWYHLTALSPWVTLEELFSGPVVSHSWRMVAVSPKILSLSEDIVHWGTIEPMVSTSLLGKGFPGDSSGSCALEVDMIGCLSAHGRDMRERPCLSAFKGFLLACLLSKLFDPALL